MKILIIGTPERDKNRWNGISKQGYEVFDNHLLKKRTR